MVHEAKIAKWKAEPQPYCLTRYDHDLLRSVPAGKRRFATTGEALAAINRSSRPWDYMVDYASAFAK